MGGSCLQSVEGNINYRSADRLVINPQPEGTSTEQVKAQLLKVCDRCLLKGACMPSVESCSTGIYIKTHLATGRI